MFNKDFYPTPEEVVMDLIQGLDLQNKKILDPSSGKGDILKICQFKGAKTYGCEIQTELYEASKLYGTMIGRDFLELTREDISHINIIVMNPPFSADIRHIKHAWAIAPDGCIIRTLCNADTLRLNTFPVKALWKVIEDNNGIILQLGKCFSNSERTTNVNVAMVCISKPEKPQEDWESYFSKENIQDYTEEGLIKANFIDEIVGRYVGSLKKFEGVMQANKEINEIMGPINVGNISFGCIERESHNSYQFLNYDSFKVALQKSAWRIVFGRMDMERFMTANLKEKISKFVEEQSDVPFTIENIYNMLSFIRATNSDRMKEVLLEIFDAFTKHHHDNRYFVEGWKTNSHYMINEKIIVPHIANLRYGGGFEIDYRGATKVNDLVKALCFLTNKNYNEIKDLEHWVSHEKIYDLELYEKDEDIQRKLRNEYQHYSTDYKIKERFLQKNPNLEEFIKRRTIEEAEKGTLTHRKEFGKWYTWGFFEIKAFKKGTLHIKFKDRETWMMFNKTVAEIKGLVLPENF